MLFINNIGIKRTNSYTTFVDICHFLSEFNLVKIRNKKKIIVETTEELDKIAEILFQKIDNFDFNKYIKKAEE
ncbi:MAG: hypothetical protein QXY70_02955 [Nanopusillaceae archaeon]